MSADKRPRGGEVLKYMDVELRSETQSSARGLLVHTRNCKWHLQFVDRALRDIHWTDSKQAQAPKECRAHLEQPIHTGEPSKLPECPALSESPKPWGFF